MFINITDEEIDENMNIIQPMNDYEEHIYNYLLTNWDNNVSDFKMWLTKVCGLKLDSELYIDMDYLIRDMNSLNFWIDCFDGNIDNLYEVTEKYKVERDRQL